MCAISCDRIWESEIKRCMYSVSLGRISVRPISADSPGRSELVSRVSGAFSYCSMGNGRSLAKGKCVVDGLTLGMVRSSWEVKRVMQAAGQLCRPCPGWCKEQPEQGVIVDVEPGANDQ